MRFFNTAGPCKPEYHYMLPAAARLPEAPRIIAQFGYFVLHAPRQVGKTTAVIELAKELLAAGKYAAVMLSVEVGAAFPNDIGAAELAVLGSWEGAARFRLPKELHPPAWEYGNPGRRIETALRDWAQVCPRPLVLFLDEIDSLQDDVLMSVLRQLRSGYPDRPEGFPASLALIGLRDVRDYKIASGGSERLNTASPFNIKVRSLTMGNMGNFTAAEVAALYQQHTADTGQVFIGPALQHAFELTQGQPYLVNALAKVTVEELVPEATQPITLEHITQAKEILIQRQETHLDSLAERLREERVRNIIEPILAGQEIDNLPADDMRFVLELGLVRQTPGGGIAIANPIYREIIPHALGFITRASLPQIPATWLYPDGRLNADALLTAFLAFWRQHGEPLLRSAPYHEIAPHLVLLAFLQRVANGGGYLEREYAIGTRRMDVCLRYGPDTLGMELKVWRPHRPDPLADGLAQLDSYLNGLDLETGWLIIFDRRPDLPELSARLSQTTAQTPAGRHVTVIRA